MQTKPIQIIFSSYPFSKHRIGQKRTRSVFEKGIIEISTGDNTNTLYTYNILANQQETKKKTNHD